MNPKNMQESISFQNDEEILKEYQILVEFILNRIRGTESASGSHKEAQEQIASVLDFYAERMQESDSTIPLVSLCERLQLEPEQELLFWLLLMPQLSIDCYREYAGILQMRGESKTTCGFYLDLMNVAMGLSSGRFLDLVTKESPFTRYCLMKSQDTLLFGGSIGLRETIVRHARGQKEDTGIYHRYFQYFHHTDVLYGIDRYIEQLFSIYNSQISGAGQPSSTCSLIRLKGERYSGKKSLLYEFSNLLNRRFLVVHWEEWKTTSIENFDLLLSELLTECFLERPIIYVEDTTEEERTGHTSANQRMRELLLALLEENQMVFCSLLDGDIKNLGVPFAEIDLREDMGLRKAVWQGVLQEHPMNKLERAELLVAKYSLNAGMIRRAVAQAEIYRQMEHSTFLERHHLEQAIFASGTIYFGGLATRIPTVFGIEDIELPPVARHTLELVIKRVNLKYQVGEQCGLNKKLAYGRGVTVLFYGKPGTGKTMCAQVLAKELGMELYRVDISQLVSKYIGETEKNLSKVFDEAKKGNIILFFDEADSIFSQRTEVNGTNDKYANAEVSFLLQKMEEYPGIAILATNLMRNFDSAVMRRLTYSINFELPDKDTVIRLWQSILPAHVKFDKEIDFAYLAENLNLSGSNIKSILYNAAYMAASEDSEEIVITPAELIPAIQMEHEKLGEFLNRSSLGKYFMYTNMLGGEKHGE